MTQIIDALSGKLTGREVELKGWIYRTRTVGGKIFVVLRDSTGVLQVTITKGEVRPEQFAAAEKALLESAVKVFGTIVQDKRAPGGHEIRAMDVQVVSPDGRLFAGDLLRVRDQSIHGALPVAAALNPGRGWVLTPNRQKKGMSSRDALASACESGRGGPAAGPARAAVRPSEGGPMRRRGQAR